MRAWLNKLIDSTDPTRDAKLLAFSSVVCASIVWLTREQLRGPITDQWVSALYGLFALVGLGGSAWALVDKFRGTPGTTISSSATTEEKKDEEKS
jgi:hypothetical protein